MIGAGLRFDPPVDASAYNAVRFTYTSLGCAISFAPMTVTNTSPSLDPRGLYATVINESISMCGFGPAVIMLTAARNLGAQKAELVRYATSADVSGDYGNVVGYAGIIVS